MDAFAFGDHDSSQPAFSRRAMISSALAAAGGAAAFGAAWCIAHSHRRSVEIKFAAPLGGKIDFLSIRRFATILTLSTSVYLLGSLNGLL
jgi:hypothetical protein